MAVPNTTNFTLQDVTTEIYGDTAADRNLSQCFTDATGTFDGTYNPNSNGTSNNLLNFRNYNHNPGNQLNFIIDSFGYLQGFLLDSGTCGSSVNATFTYVSNAQSDLPITVSHAGTARSPGYSYTTNISLTEGNGFGCGYFGRGDWTVTSGNFGNSSSVTFRMEINSSTADTLPTTTNPLSHPFSYFT